MNKDELIKRIAYLRGQIAIIQKNTKELSERHEKEKKEFFKNYKKNFFTDLLPVIDTIYMYQNNKENYPEEAEKQVFQGLKIEIPKFKKKYEENN